MASQPKHLIPPFPCSARKYRIKSCRHSVAVVVGSLLLSAIGFAEILRQEATPPAQPTQQPAPPQPVEHPSSASIPSSSEATGAAPLRVMVGKSLLINTSGKLKRVSVTDPNVADVQVVTPTQILVHGRSAGEVSLLIWDESERARSFDLRVDVDVTAATEEVKRIFPEEQIDISASRSAIVLSGHVTSEDAAKHAGMVAAAYSK